MKILHRKTESLVEKKTTEVRSIDELSIWEYIALNPNLLSFSYNITIYNMYSAIIL